MIQQTLKLIPITIIQMENCILLILLWDRAEMIPISISVTKQAERLIPSMHTACSTVNSLRQVERLIKIWSNWMKAAMTVI